MTIDPIGRGGRFVDEATRLLERLDDRGLHMTVELRQRAEELAETAGEWDWGSVV